MQYPRPWGLSLFEGVFTHLFPFMEYKYIDVFPNLGAGQVVVTGAERGGG
jgi:hypothetical protein